MYGAMIGDIVGSIYEFDNIKKKEFPFFQDTCEMTDDSILSVAVAKAILDAKTAHIAGDDKSFESCVMENLLEFGRKYPYPMGGYGGGFFQWLRKKAPKPYGSYGNGSAMRVSACGIVAVSLEEAQKLAEISARVTHNHPEGIKGAVATASAIYLAKIGKTKQEIGSYIEENFYQLSGLSVKDLQKTYSFSGSCQGTVPQGIVAFLESESYEDAIRNVMAIGGDSDTMGSITGGIAWMYYSIQTVGYANWCAMKLNPEMMQLKAEAEAFIPADFLEIVDAFHKLAVERMDVYSQTGSVVSIMSLTEQAELA